MPNAEEPSFCTSRPKPGAMLAGACEECGHALVLHIGVEHCPVCEMVHHNAQVRDAMTENRVEVHVTGVDHRVLERTIERMSAQAAMSNRSLSFRR